jgi:hypothetical protein
MYVVVVFEDYIRIRRPRRSKKSWELLVVGLWWITLSVCVHILQGRKFLRQILLQNSESRATRGLLLGKEMDPGRYALHQGWDNNSVIVVSSLVNKIHLCDVGMNIIQRNY